MNCDKTVDETIGKLIEVVAIDWVTGWSPKPRNKRKFRKIIKFKNVRVTYLIEIIKSI